MMLFVYHSKASICGCTTDNCNGKSVDAIAAADPNSVKPLNINEFDSKLYQKLLTGHFACLCE